METIIMDGASQHDRTLPALRPSYIRPDEMALPDLLFAMSRHAGLLSYFGLDDRPSGDWRPLFAGDETLLLATILAETRRLDHRRVQFRRWLAHMQAFAAGLEACPGPGQVPLWHIATQIQGWLEASRRIPTQGAERLHGIVEGLVASTLAPALSALADFLGPHDPRHLELHRRLGEAWRDKASLRPADASPASLSLFLGDIFRACAGALTVIDRDPRRRHAVGDFPGQR